MTKLLKIYINFQIVFFQLQLKQLLFKINHDIRPSDCVQSSDARKIMTFETEEDSLISIEQ